MLAIPIHPIMQSIAILCMLYAWYSGVPRFRMLHLNQKARFNWKRHVRTGLAGSIVMLTGIVVGLVVVNLRWYTLFVTDLHWKIGLLMIPLILFAIGSGLYMDRKKKKRKALPLAHGISNTVMIILALIQAYTGINIYIDHVYYIYFG